MILNIEEVYYADREQDIIVFRVDNPGKQTFNYLEINIDETYKVGDMIYIMVSESLFGSLYQGEGEILEINAAWRVKHNRNLITQSDIIICDIKSEAGASGGAAINDKNQVIGVLISATVKPGKNGIYATGIRPISQIADILIELGVQNYETDK